MSTSNNLHEILDKLLIDSLTLTQRHINLKLELESLMHDGEDGLVRARYIMGRNSLSKLQLPSEDSNDVNAAAKVEFEEDSDVSAAGINERSLVMEKFDDLHANPIKWFGILVPASLHNAQDRFKRCLYKVVECVNVQKMLDRYLSLYKGLESRL